MRKRRVCTGERERDVRHLVSRCARPARAGTRKPDREAAGEYLRTVPERMTATGMNDPSPPSCPTRSRLSSRPRRTGAGHHVPRPVRRLADPERARWRWRGRHAVEGCSQPPMAISTPRSPPSSTRSHRRLSPLPTRAGRTLLCLGTVRRQAQQKQGGPGALEQALAVFEEVARALWAAKHARSSLGSAAALPPRRS